MKKCITLASLCLIAGVTNADIKQNFNKVNAVKKVPQLKRSTGKVSIAKNGGSKVLRIGGPKGALKLKTGLTSKEFSVKVDCLIRKGANGSVMQLTGTTPQSRFLTISAKAKSVTASSYFGSKEKMRTVFTPKKNTWYRFEVEVIGKSYTIKVTDRGEQNTGDEAEVVYDSTIAKKRFRVNTNIEPKIITFNQYGRNAGLGIDYDNIVLEN